MSGPLSAVLRNTDCVFERYATAVTMEIAYGHHIESDDDPAVRSAERCLDVSVGVGDPGSSIVDLLPFRLFFLFTLIPQEFSLDN